MRVILFIVLSLLTISAFTQTCESPVTLQCYPMCSISDSIVGSPYAAEIAKLEGCCLCAYLGKSGYTAIGVGYLLTPSKEAELARIGANYTSLASGESGLTIYQVSQLFENHLNYAQAVARNFYPNFDSLPNPAKSGLVIMAYHLGDSGMSQFQQLNTDLSAGDYSDAITAFHSSIWCGEDTVRCDYVKRFFLDALDNSDTASCSSDTEDDYQGFTDDDVNFSHPDDSDTENDASSEDTDYGGFDTPTSLNNNNNNNNNNGGSDDSDGDILSDAISDASDAADAVGDISDAISDLSDLSPVADVIIAAIS